MAINADSLYQEALNLPDDSRLALAERLLESVEPDPVIIEAQMTEVRRRIEDLDSGRVAAVPGPEGLRRVRDAVAKRSKG